MVELILAILEFSLATVIGIEVSINIPVEERPVYFSNHAKLAP